jgi:hypothetical protein
MLAQLQAEIIHTLHFYPSGMRGIAHAKTMF